MHHIAITETKGVKNSTQLLEILIHIELIEKRKTMKLNEINTAGHFDRIHEYLNRIFRFLY